MIVVLLLPYSTRDGGGSRSRGGRRGFDAVTRLDDVGFERDGASAAMELEKEAACIAEYLARLVAAPERCGGRRAVLADGGGRCDGGSH